MIPIKCPKCTKDTAIMWCMGPDGLCDSCYFKKGRKPEGSGTDYVCMFLPAQGEDGLWQQPLEFKSLREFIDDCLKNKRVSGLPLTDSPESIEGLLGILELTVSISDIGKGNKKDKTVSADQWLSRLHQRLDSGHPWLSKRLKLIVSEN